MRHLPWEKRHGEGKSGNREHAIGEGKTVSLLSSEHEMMGPKRNRISNRSVFSHFRFFTQCRL